MKRFFITSLVLAAVVLGLLAFIIIQFKECASGVIPKFSHIPNGVYTMDSMNIEPAAILTISYAKSYCTMSYVEETHVGDYNIPGELADKGFNFRGPVIGFIGYDLMQGKSYLSPNTRFYVTEENGQKIITLHTDFMPPSVTNVSVEAYTNNDYSWFSGEIPQDTAFKYVIKPVCTSKIVEKIRSSPDQAKQIVTNAKNAIGLNVKMMLDGRMQGEPYIFRMEFGNDPFTPMSSGDNEIPVISLDPIIEDLHVPVQATQKLDETLDNWKRKIRDAFK